jgi:hypothetical protein
MHVLFDFTLQASTQLFSLVVRDWVCPGSLPVNYVASGLPYDLPALHFDEPVDFVILHRRTKIDIFLLKSKSKNRKISIFNTC